MPRNLLPHTRLDPSPQTGTRPSLRARIRCIRTRSFLLARRHGLEADRD